MQSGIIGSLRYLWTHKVMKELIVEQKSILQAALDAVKPSVLIHDSLRREGNKLQLKNKEYILNHNVYVIGFGKAVAGMAPAIENILGEHLIEGILSVPKGTKKILDKIQEQPCKKIILYEGAENNLPDLASYENALKIINVVKDLTENHLIIILISGGGSTLLCVPKLGITLKDKLETTKLLAGKGATIQEMNIVRQQISLVKGGGLIKLCYPAKVISLILSDIIDDPLDLIASGPTVYSSPKYTSAQAILEKYDIFSEIPFSVQTLLQAQEPSSCSIQIFENVTNILLGNNSKALLAAHRMAEQLGLISLVLTEKLNNDVRVIGNLLACLIEFILNRLEKAIFPEEQSSYITELLQNLNCAQNIEQSLIEAINIASYDQKGICLLLGGETTVVVQGNGKGGRNQELALSCAIEINEKISLDLKSKYTVNVVCFATDGQDGPTDAAGAVVSLDLIQNITSALTFLDNNDSYSFFKKVNKGKNMIVTGLTGTNVMDIVFILIKLHS